ncbi:TonB family protein [Sphingomonas sp. S1-29]|uniref:energy transducer TonB n=1 Tax=Sphingomonas sp. S1-29 TaxID=2991074 RepID=UPI00223F321F|nr:energy transducer TonB [Sphingomonas sp. S1-29]UZK69856.1 TonB family protein [Sphingomonas sp. S1-29]
MANEMRLRLTLFFLALLWSTPTLTRQHQTAQLRDVQPILPADYPLQAAEARVEGVIEMLLLTGLDGSVDHCVVSDPMAATALAEATCALLSARAQFEPASNDGRPMRSTVRARVAWTLPKTPDSSPSVTTEIAPPRIGKEAGASPKAPPATWFPLKAYPRAAKRRGEGGSVTMLLLIDRAGRVRECNVIEGSGSTNLDEGSCMLARQNGRFTPALDVDGKAREAQYLLPGVNWVP